MIANGTKMAAQNRNHHRRCAGIGAIGFPGEKLVPFVERAFWGKCFFGFKPSQLNTVNLPGKWKSRRFDSPVHYDWEVVWTENADVKLRKVLQAEKAPAHETEKPPDSLSGGFMLRTKIQSTIPPALNT
jgi:hypothetical protein